MKVKTSIIAIDSSKIANFKRLSNNLQKDFSLYPYSQSNQNAWFEYYGDPSKRPTFIQKILYELDNIHGGKRSVERYIKRLKEREVKELKEILKEEDKTIEDVLYEKEIEEILFKTPKLIEPGLKIIENGRQFQTEIGRIDLLTESIKKEFVIIEIKRDDADDRVIGQILRYIGWVHQKLCTQGQGVRGIVMAGGFPQKVQFSRLGLLRPDYSTFIKFQLHPLVSQIVE